MKKDRELQITTSWDDGHPLDLRVAELLAKYGLRGTFYIPLKNSRPTLQATEIRDLAREFEVGAHTVHHVDLTELNNDDARTEIFKSKAQLEEITGSICNVFCFPKGRYTRPHLAMAAEAGFTAVRTVELLSLDPPRMRNGLALIPTTVQAYPHKPLAYLRNCVKRRSATNLWHFLGHGGSKKWDSAAASMLELAVASGGVFHLWGHSWEIEEAKQWTALERIFAALAHTCLTQPCVSNSELCADVR